MTVRTCSFACLLLGFSPCDTLDRPALDLSKASFLAIHNKSYGYGRPDFEAFVTKELGSRMKEQVYLDYAASGLYTNSQIDAHSADLRENLYGNPHSLSSSALRSSEAIEAARSLVLAFFAASPSAYDVIFTRSCTDSLRLVADTFPWSAASEFRYLVENHNSVLGIRDVARNNGAVAHSVLPEEVDLELDRLAADNSPPGNTALSLFAYPAEENFAGGMFPLEWASKVATRKGALRNWRVLLDAAKFSASHPLNLTEVSADFVTLSFYKLFGYPTGVGALIIKQEIADELKKIYWGGGSVTVAGAGLTAADDLKVFKSKLAERFEDGTVSFLDIAALRHGFAALYAVGGMAAIEKHTQALASYLHELLEQLLHQNGRSVIQLYSGRADVMQGPVVNFNVLRPDGSVVSHIDVMAKAAQAGIHLRAGAHCNPGAASLALGLTPDAVASMANDPEMQGCGLGPAFIKRRASEVASGTLTRSAIEDPAVEIPLGSVRVSVGYLSTFPDIQALVEFLQQEYQQ
eukprot:TRINITY_DN34433_c0_g1_i1.p1 TRINITY_DN34433_c0_g1~~TRINITY_DN34433_c0_g1_i1.p1  ORF type:complete len:532 (-),score=91.92 TRINITY_DN34433_c0_g1_i1:30-1589(-)